MELMRGKNSVEVFNDAELIQTLELIRKAVESGGGGSWISRSRLRRNGSVSGRTDTLAEIG